MLYVSQRLHLIKSIHRVIKGRMVRGFGMSRLAYALYAITTMYFFFMILDRALSLIFGFNFQPYGPSLPAGFTIWGHLFNGALAILGMWVTLKAWDAASSSGSAVIFRTAIIVLTLALNLWIPYNNDAAYLVSRGQGGAIPLYVVANAAYVMGASIVTLRLVRSTEWRLTLLIGLVISFLFIHFVLYAPVFPEFRWT